MHMTFRHLNNKKASSISFISLFYETQNDTRKKLIFLGRLKFIHETFQMKTVDLDDFLTKSKTDILLCIFCCLWIEFFEFMKSSDIHKINLHINISHQNYCILNRFYITPTSYGLSFPLLNNTFCLYIPWLVYVFFLQKLSMTLLQLLERFIGTLHDFTWFYRNGNLPRNTYFPIDL